MTRGVFSDVLVAVDGTRRDDTAISHAEELTVDDGTIHLIYVVQISELAGSSLATNNMTAYNQMEEKGERIVSEASESISSQSTSTIVEPGIADREIPRVAEEAVVDAVVMVTRGDTGLSRLLFPSIPENVVRRTDVPVFAVPDRD